MNQGMRRACGERFAAKIGSRRDVSNRLVERTSSLHVVGKKVPFRQRASSSLLGRLTQRLFKAQSIIKLDLPSDSKATNDFGKASFELCALFNHIAPRVTKLNLIHQLKWSQLSSHWPTASLFDSYTAFNCNRRNALIADPDRGPPLFQPQSKASNFSLVEQSRWGDVVEHVQFIVMKWCRTLTEQVKIRRHFVRLPFLSAEVLYV